LTRIKICGITNAEDAELAVEYGADALGFIMVPESKRYVPADEVERIARSLKKPSPFTSIVAVVRSVVEARNVGSADCAQFYEGSPLDSNGRQRLIPVLRVRSIKDLGQLANFVRTGIGRCGQDVRLDDRSPGGQHISVADYCSGRLNPR